MHTRALLMLIPLFASAQSLIDADARRGIAAGNQAWIDGMKRGDAKLIASSYAEDALDCSPIGDCTQGRAAIEQQLASRVQKLGRASAASVTSRGSTQQGDFIYEWGEAQASFPNGARVSGRYLTVWRKQSGGAWLIWRNVRIPSESAPRQ